MSLSAQIAAVVASAEADALKFKAIVNGPATGPTSEVTTDNGPVKTAAAKILEIEERADDIYVARDDAQTAATQASAARDAAEGFRDEAEGFKNSAESAAGTAAADASAAAVAAVQEALGDEVTAAETARAGAEAAQAGAEAVETGLATLLPAPGLMQSFRGNYVYDIFDETDKLLNGKASKGNVSAPWSLTGAGAAGAQVVNGRILVSDNTYSSLSPGGLVNRGAGVFFYDLNAAAYGQGPSALIIQNGTTLSHMVHFQFTNKGANLTKVTALAGGGVFVGMGVNPKWDLKLDGTKYGVAIELDHVAQTVTIVGPDGVRYTTAPDADMFSLPLNTVTFQQSNWCAVEVGERSQAEKLVMLGNGQNASEATGLRGQIGSYKHQGIKFPITTVGWYRILTSGDSYRGFSISGTVKIAAMTTAYNSMGEFIIMGDSGGPTIATNGIIQRFWHGTGGSAPVITQARLSWLTDTSCALDVYVNRNDGGGNVFVNFEGVGNLEHLAVVGATALATGNSVYTFDLANFNSVPSQEAGFSNIRVGGGGFSGNGGLEMRGNGANRIGYFKFIGGGNFTGTIEFGVNGTASDLDAPRLGMMNAAGMLIGATGSAAVPYHANNAATTSARQSGGVRLQSGAGSGQTIQSLEWADGLGVVCAIDALREGGGFGHTLRFWTMDAAGALTQVGSLNSAGVYVATAPIRKKGYTVATLPAGTVGDTAYVTDATAPTYLGALVGGGAVKCPVFYNGSAWVSG